MIPIQLAIEGLYSYQNRQTIDFNNLIEAGLFGIFGAVGSGKSSILEAITFALYGETERLNSRDKRAYNMMNLKSNRSYIEFDFINYQDRIFRVTREFKRNSKKFDDVKLANAVFFEQKNNEWIPLEHTNAEELIGLSYQNFKRTIIIPQGQFKEFIELGATDRTKMMKEIFNLHRFDLQDKVSVVAKKNQSNLDQLQGKLSGFEEVSEEQIQELTNQLIEQEKIANKTQIEFNGINEKFQQLKVLKTDFENLKQKKIEFENQRNLKLEMDQREAELIQYELIFNQFNQLLIDFESVENQIKSKNILFEAQQKQLALIENKIQEISNQIKILQPSFELLSEKRKEENDLEFIVQILEFLQEVEKLKERTQNGLQKVEEVKQTEKLIDSEIKEIEKELKNISENKIDSKILMEVDNWFSQTQNLSKTYKNQELKLKEISSEIEKINLILKENKIEISSFEENYNTENNELEKQRKTLEQQRTDLEVQQKLTHFSHNLKDGEVCPLCGALDHPNIVRINDVSAKIIEFEKGLDEINTKQKNALKKFNEFQKAIQQKSFFDTQFNQERIILNDLKNQMNNQVQIFNWKDFDANDFEGFVVKKNTALEIEKQILSKQKTITEKRELQEKARLDVEKFKQVLEEFKLKETEKLSQIKQLQSNLKVLTFENYSNETQENVQLKLDNLKALNVKIDQDYNQFVNQSNELNLKFTSRKTALDLLEKQILVDREESKQLSLQIEEKINQTKIESLEEVYRILGLKLNVIELRKAIENFKIGFETLKNSIKELEQKLAKVSFDDNLFDAVQQQLIQISEALKQATEVVTKTKMEINRLEKAFQEKKSLLVEFDQLQKRAINIKTLQNMFYKAGFVNYVSSIYLKQLCENANIRFHRMTKNQLSLQMNEENDFEIIDYLNEGRSRSVKTLSGGQAFQVSLSLALALAESVQSNSKADRNFFFIDEGFGTQDADAVNIVFETLNHLHKENRIVGIISHVEELKERIPVSLNIVKDEENGSEILLN